MQGVNLCLIFLLEIVSIYCFKQEVLIYIYELLDKWQAIKYEYSLNIEVYQFDCLNTLNAFDQTKMFENIEIFEAWRDSRTNKIIWFQFNMWKNFTTFWNTFDL